MLRFPSPSMAVALTALVVALGGAGIAATGGNFILGVPNTATSRTSLTAHVGGTALLVTNNSTAAGASALNLVTAANRPPLRVSSTTRVANLNADAVDGLDAAAFARAASEGWHYIGTAGEPGFLNGWTNLGAAQAGPFQDAAYRIDQNGVVHLSGLIKGGTVDQPAFKLKGQYCPYWVHPFAVLSDDGGARPSSLLGRVDVFFEIDESGCDVRVTEGNAETFVVLDGISYRSVALDGDVAAPPSGRVSRLGSATRKR